MFRIAYSFNPENGEYTGAVQAQKSPLEVDVYLLPANALFEQPPPIQENEVACAVDGVWVIKPDFRGTWYKPNSDVVVIKAIGEIPDVTWSLSEPPKSFDTIKTEIRAKVNQKRNSYEVAGFPYMGKVFDSDPRSFYRITTANDAALKDPTFSIEWTVADNTKLAMNAQEMLGVMPALAGYGQIIFNNSVALKELVEAAETLQELDDVDIESGWPDINDYL
jgi:hypothetical protein